MAFGKANPEILCLLVADIMECRSIVCRDGAGVDCDSFAESGEMRMLGKNLNARREVLQIAVYPDSYAHFHKLRNLLVESGIEYNWVPVSGPLVVGESSTTESQ